VDQQDPHKAYAQNFLGAMSLRQGDFDQAYKMLNESLNTFQRFQNAPDVLQSLVWLGQLFEVQQDWSTAFAYYHRCMELKWTKRNNYICEALTGLVRVHHATGDYAAIPDVLAEAESLAQQYEYNDHLASLRLSQGHIAWDGHIPAWGSGFDAALAFYQQSLIYALRYNRFLLDEVLWGGNITTPLQPIIPHCQQRGDEGMRMLTALRDWWQTGVNDSGTPCPDTISLVPEGVPLREAERIARANEPGDGSPQREVVDVLRGAMG
jgi:tetratricopeptide (TPR) repeat protein